MNSEFDGKTFRECAEIIVGNENDKSWTDKQVNELVKQHELRLNKSNDWRRTKDNERLTRDI